MASMSIIELNSLALIQDFGRFRHQHQGISVNGAADEFAFLKANHCLGNHVFTTRNDKSNEQSASLEVFYGQIKLAFDDSCYIAITGADCQPYVISKNKTRNDIPMWQPYLVEAGDSIVLNRPSKGVISYIAVKGGIRSPQFLGSRAQSVVANQQMPVLSPLVKDQELPFSQSNSDLPEAVLDLTKYTPAGFYASDVLYLRFVPHQHWFDAPNHQQEEWLNTTFMVDSKSNRMAYQFEKEVTTGHAFSKLSQTLSSAVNFGTIQILPSGLPLVLMKDRQTMGGYPTLGNVFQIDLFRLAQLTPGQKVKFIPAEIEQAQSQLNAFYQRFMPQ